jgi:hypothetical protein
LRFEFFKGGKNEKEILGICPCISSTFQPRCREANGQYETKTRNQIVQTSQGERKKDEEKNEEKKEEKQEEVKKENVKQSKSDTKPNNKSKTVSDSNKSKKNEEKKTVSTPKKKASINNSSKETHEKITNDPAFKDLPKIHYPPPNKPPKKHHKPEKEKHKSDDCSGFSIIVGSYLSNLGPARDIRVNVNVRNVYNKDEMTEYSKELPDEFYQELEDYLNSLYMPLYDQFHREYYFLLSFSNAYDYDHSHYGPHHGERCSYHHDSCYHNSSRSYRLDNRGYCCNTYYNRYYVDFYFQKGEDLLLTEEYFDKDGILRSDLKDNWESYTLFIEATSDSEDICEDYNEMFEECITLFVLEDLPEETEKAHEIPMMYLAVDDDACFESYATEFDHFLKWKFPIYFKDPPSFDCCEGAYQDHSEWVLYNSCGKKSKHHKTELTEDLPKLDPKMEKLK